VSSQDEPDETERTNASQRPKVSRSGREVDSHLQSRKQTTQLRYTLRNRINPPIPTLLENNSPHGSNDSEQHRSQPSLERRVDCSFEPLPSTSKGGERFGEGCFRRKEEGVLVRFVVGRDVLV